MFYVGFRFGFEGAAIGIAWSQDGIENWVRYARNPVVAPGPPGSWDSADIYKPSVARVRDEILIWYNARRFGSATEHIGVATLGVPELESWIATLPQV